MGKRASMELKKFLSSRNSLKNGKTVVAEYKGEHLKNDERFKLLNMMLKKLRESIR